ncbi:hypothetical protein VaNZ11_013752, partial [Volvox africanus]
AGSGCRCPRRRRRGQPLRAGSGSAGRWRAQRRRQQVGRASALLPIELRCQRGGGLEGIQLTPPTGLLPLDEGSGFTGDGSRVPGGSAGRGMEAAQPAKRRAAGRGAHPVPAITLGEGAEPPEPRPSSSGDRVVPDPHPDPAGVDVF